VRAILTAGSLLLIACGSKATFLALTDLNVVASPTRSETAPNQTVGLIKAGTLTTDAPVVEGKDYRLFQVDLPDAGSGYVRRDSRLMQIYREE
jgi:hypothetical protein